MIQQALTRLQYLSNTIPALLNNIPDQQFSSKPSPGKWSKKEILGHLVDSATNNHQRFVRAQFEDTPTIVYDQNNWNAFSYYNHLNSELLIEFWASYNKHLVELVKNIPQEGLIKQCNNGGEESRTLEWLFIDYVAHLEHHMKQIVDY